MINNQEISYFNSPPQQGVFFLFENLENVGSQILKVWFLDLEKSFKWIKS